MSKRSCSMDLGSRAVKRERRDSLVDQVMPDCEPSSRLELLPPELRLEIYKHLLPTTTIRLDGASCKHPLSSLTSTLP